MYGHAFSAVHNAHAGTKKFIAPTELVQPEQPPSEWLEFLEDDELAECRSIWTYVQTCIRLLPRRRRWKALVEKVLTLTGKSILMCYICRRRCDQSRTRGNDGFFDGFPKEKRAKDRIVPMTMQEVEDYVGFVSTYR